MSNLILFQFDSQDVRFIDNKPVANDVALVLGYA
jgi:prophage antirepressor-like protein